MPARQPSSCCNCTSLRTYQLPKQRAASPQLHARQAVQQLLLLRVEQLRQHTQQRLQTEGCRGVERTVGRPVGNNTMNSSSRVSTRMGSIPGDCEAATAGASFCPRLDPSHDGWAPSAVLPNHANSCLRNCSQLTNTDLHHGWVVSHRQLDHERLQQARQQRRLQNEQKRGPSHVICQPAEYRCSTGSRDSSRHVWFPPSPSVAPRAAAAP